MFERWFFQGKLEKSRKFFGVWKKQLVSKTLSGFQSYNLPQHMVSEVVQAQKNNECIGVTVLLLTSPCRTFLKVFKMI